VNSTGVVTADYVNNFTQDDLLTDLVCLVDAYTVVYLWVGSRARESDKKVAMETAVEYLPIHLIFSAYNPDMYRKLLTEGAKKRLF
jgi:hypothetical protein